MNEINLIVENIFGKELTSANFIIFGEREVRVRNCNKRRRIAVYIIKQIGKSAVK